MTELGRFRDYWTAQPGQKGVKTDWPATWRNWVRRAAETSQKPGQQSFAERDTAAKSARFHEMTRGAFAAQQPTGVTIDMEANDGTPRLLA